MYWKSGNEVNGRESLLSFALAKTKARVGIFSYQEEGEARISAQTLKSSVRKGVEKCVVVLRNSLEKLTISRLSLAFFPLERIKTQFKLK